MKLNLENDFCSFDECVGCVPFDDFDPIDDEILVYNDIVCIALKFKFCKFNIFDYSLSCDSEIQKWDFLMNLTLNKMFQIFAANVMQLVI